MADLITRQFEGRPVQFDDAGWINATAVARMHGKEPNDWLRQRETVEYLVELGVALGISGCLPEFNEINALAGDSAAYRSAALRLAKKTGLVRTKAGSPVNGGGTWLHPKARVLLGRWVNARFAVWCDMEIDGILRQRLGASDEPLLSTVRDREPILIDSVLLMTRHRLSLPRIYRALSHYVGVNRFQSMTREQVAEAHQFAARLLDGRDTGADWRRLESGRAAAIGMSAQSRLDLHPASISILSGGAHA